MYAEWQKKDSVQMKSILSNEELGAKLRNIRKNKRFSQEQLAEALDVSGQLIQQYEAGRSQMSAQRLQAIALALGVTVGELFDEPPSTLTGEEEVLVRGYRSLPNEVKKFILNCLCK